VKEAYYVGNRLAEIDSSDHRARIPRAIWAGELYEPEARSLDNQIAQYACSFTRQASWNSPKKLVLELTQASPDDEKERQTSEAYRVMFRARTKAALRDFAEQLPMVVLLIVLAVFLLWLAHHVEGFAWDEETAKTAAEAVRLGAWISGWTSISLLFSHGVESLRDFAAFGRLARIPIAFEYSMRQQVALSA
jgi:hypothetical protein